MKDKIIATFGEEKLEHKENINYPHLYVIDLSRRSNKKEDMKIFDAPQENIATLLIENPKLIEISVAYFKPQCFQDEHGYEPDNCECVFYLSNSTNETWVLFLEIKDCDSGNISTYFKKAKVQIIKTVQAFRDKKIINDDKRVFANVSFPRTGQMNYFNHFIKHPEKKKFLDEFNIFIKGTNKLKIENHKKIT